MWIFQYEEIRWQPITQFSCRLSWLLGFLGLSWATNCALWATCFPLQVHVSVIFNSICTILFLPFLCLVVLWVRYFVSEFRPCFVSLGQKSNYLATEVNVCGQLALFALGLMALDRLFCFEMLKMWLIQWIFEEYNEIELSLMLVWEKTQHAWGITMYPEQMKTL